MLVLINTNRMRPPIAPIGIDYVACAVRKAGFEVDVLDLCVADEPEMVLRQYFATHDPKLVGLSLRNVDDCFWPSAAWFVPDLMKTISSIRNMTYVPIVLGGVGFSIFAEKIVRYTDVEFGIRGDGEWSMTALLKELLGSRRYETVPGLIWRLAGNIASNDPAWPQQLQLPTERDAIDNLSYFNKGGQCGLETKRGCNRKCIYCADPLAKGCSPRVRQPHEVADEAQSLLDQGVDVLHLCDSEFNIPREHAMAVCDEFIKRGLAERLKWYTYMAVLPFDAELAAAMRKAGCVGIDFTGDAANASMLKTYCQCHDAEHLQQAVQLCKENNIKVMIDLLLGGPGETEDTARQTIDFIKQIDPYCAGAALGIRIYPNTPMEKIVQAEGPMEDNPNIRRKYIGRIDLLQPTYYISQHLGQKPAELIQDLIASDKRFFEPLSEFAKEVIEAGSDYNYNDNRDLEQAIANGARGAYWDILRQLRN
ncbi:MAG: B12-binding domain-containing radical SAM protein [Planctomycetota bacterium]